jgi:hypothetical protein
MAATKGVSTFTWASGSAISSGTTNPVSCATYYAQDLAVTIAQVGTATTAASFQVQYSFDASTYYTLATYTAGTGAATYTWTINIPATAQYVQIVYSAQSGGTSSTLNAQLGEVTGI